LRSYPSNENLHKAAVTGRLRRVERIGAIDHVVFMGAIGAPKDSAEHFVEHGERGVDEHGLHFAREHDQRRHSARHVETGKMLSAHNSAFARDCRISRAVNALFTIGSDAELAHGFEPFNGFGANSDPIRPPIPISFRPPFRFEAGHRSEMKPAT
jgi:hypothetical protein